MVRKICVGMSVSLMWLSAIVSAFAQVPLPQPASPLDRPGVVGKKVPSGLSANTPPTRMHGRNNAVINGLPRLNTRLPNAVGIIGNSAGQR